MKERFDIVIVGAGQAGQRAAHAARATNADSSILLIGEEAHFPYERPRLSKEALMMAVEGDDGIAATAVERKDAASYLALRIVVRRGLRVTSIDRTQRLIYTEASAPERAQQASGDAGGVLEYGRLIIATGSRVRRLPAAVYQGAEIHYLRTHDDAEALKSALRPGKRLAVIGAGFIGLEVAAAGRHHGMDVIVIDQSPQVLGRVFPAAASDYVEQWHAREGVAFKLATAIERIEQSEGGTFSIVTKSAANSEIIHADVVVAGIGVLPNTELATAAGLDADNGLMVDACGRTSDPLVFGAGEVTRHPVNGIPMRIESWQVAELQAAACGATAAGNETPYDALPWFWSDQFALNIQCLGSTPAGAQQVVRSAPAAAPDSPSGSDGTNTALVPQSRFFLNDHNEVIGVITFDSGKDISAARRLIQRRTKIDPILLANPAASWKQVMGS